MLLNFYLSLRNSDVCLVVLLFENNKDDNVDEGEMR